ncbi:MAG: UbiD family decarboxylase [Ardenticatenaceae bacterium]|nr:UbiD family decarboxylase [Ardenticatenaceae bacterium]
MTETIRMQADLRAFLEILAENDKLLRLPKPVNPHSELAELILQAEKRGKAVLFESVTGSDRPCVANIVGDRVMLGLAFGVRPAEVVPYFLARSKQRIPPIITDTGPVQEIVLTSDDIDLRQLPLVVHSEKDAGPYITAGLVIAKDPQTEVRNVSFNRMMLRSPNEVGIRMMPPQHLGQIYERATARGEPLEVAVVLGNHPAELVAGATSIPQGEDEFALAGALRGEPLELVKCQTVDLEVPARAEIVLEGEVLPGTAEPEGPFGDFMQFYVPVMNNRVLRIKAITRRRDAIYQTMHAGVAEDTTLLAISREAQLLEAITAAGTEVREISLLPSILAGAISIRKRFEGEPKLVLAAAFGRYRWLKFCVVVDEDVDVSNIDDVWWALATRSRLDRGLLHITDAAGFPRDPYGLHTAKVGIDATVPLGSWHDHKRKRPPGHGQIRLEEFT